METLLQNLWLNSLVLLVVSLGEVIFLYGLSRELREVHASAERINASVERVAAMCDRTERMTARILARVAGIEEKEQ